MNERTKANLEKLDSLRDQALCGPAETRDEAQQAYEVLRSELLEHEPCQGCDDEPITQNLETK
jgi:hypothetical protein